MEIIAEQIQKGEVENPFAWKSAQLKAFLIKMNFIQLKYEN